MKILVVDDEREIVDSIGIFLSGEGYKVLERLLFLADCVIIMQNISGADL